MEARPQAPDAHAEGIGMPERTALLFTNAASRQGGTDLAPAIEALGGGGIRLVDEQPPDVTGLPAWIMAHRDDVDLVIIGGGDGTLNAAADALIETGLPLGILPLGTANDLARTLGIPDDLEAASRVIAAGWTHRIDLGRANGKHFFNVASLGLSVEIARQLDVEVKRRWGVLGYPLILWRAIRTRRAFRARIRCDGVSMRVLAMQISVGNGRHYGGGMTIAADAAIDDGALDLVSVAPQGLWELVVNLPALRWGWHQRAERIRHWRCRELEIRTARPVPINTDGEVTTTTPAEIIVVPDAISVFVPRRLFDVEGVGDVAG